MGQWSETTTHSLCFSQPPRTNCGCPFECRRMWSIQLMPTCSAPVPTCLAIQWVNIELDDLSASEWRGLLSDIELAYWLVFLWYPPIAVEPQELLRSPCSKMTLSTELLIWLLILSCILLLMNSSGSEKLSCFLRNLLTLFHSWELSQSSTGRIGKYAESKRSLRLRACSVSLISSPMFVKSRVKPVTRVVYFSYMITICPPTLSAPLIADGTEATQIWTL